MIIFNGIRYRFEDALELGLIGPDGGAQVEGVAFDNNPLSQREQEVLAMVAQGSTNQEIAESLFLSNGTVRNYMTAILTKLDAGNRTEAVRIAKEKDGLG